SGHARLLDRPLFRPQTVLDWTTGSVLKTECGGFAHYNVNFEPESYDGLGVGYLSRYVVTLDFPRRRLFLQKGRHYDRADQCDQSGLTIVMRDGEFEVVHVWACSPASE